MGLIERCYETYERNLPQVGKSQKDPKTGWELTMLLPVAHTTQKVQVEVQLNGQGDFLSGRVLRPDETTTVIPCTEKSSARTSGPVPHPLVDKLLYIAGDYEAFGGPKKSQWKEYLTQLTAWCQSPYGHSKVRSVLAYLEQGTLIEDLVKAHVLYIDEDGHLLRKWNGPKEDTPMIFSLLAAAGGNPFETFVRFCVEGDCLSEDREVWDSFINYYLSTLKDIGVCTVQGKKVPISLLSPYKIRNAGDRAKLISSNDETNFTFRGERFINAEQALSIGYETTQKAHSALRWLIGRQGVCSGDQAILVWGLEGEPVPSLTEDSYDIAADMAGEDELAAVFTSPPVSDLQTREEFARRFNKAIKGYRQQLGPHSQITVLVLDSATEGRLSIRYYRELNGSRLMDNLEDWHRNFAWELKIKKSKEDKTGKQSAFTAVFEGAPSPESIAQAAYGSRVDSKLKQQTVERLLPCITEGRLFPQDLMLSVARRASHSISLGSVEAAQIRSIACALVRGYYHRNRKEEFSMSLDNTCTDRSYLFGRVLACIHQIEKYAQYTAGSPDTGRRPTNALRFETAFTQHPAWTTALLRKQLAPYLERLIRAGKSSYYESLMLELLDRIPSGDFNDRPLSELYLLGYANQSAAFFHTDKKVPDGEKA